MAYVITKWFASTRPDTSGAYIHLTGRKGGLVSFVLARVGISPTVEVIVTDDNVLVESGSWSGFLRRVIPLRSVSSAVYGYHKPWWILLVAVVAALSMLVEAWNAYGWSNKLSALIVAVIALAIGAGIYYLNRSLIVAVIEVGGAASWLRFKRSVIEGQDVDEASAREVIDILQWLLDRKVNGSTPAAG